MADDAPDLEALQTEHKQLVGHNLNKLRQMAASQVAVDPSSIFTSRTNFFIDWLLGPLEGEEATANRLEFEIGWENQLATMLKDADAEARMAMLMKGVHAPADGAVHAHPHPHPGGN